ncbi:MAG: hypothetical protein MRZ40_10205 [Ligilactobacillus animalis]|uniref:hypothetical protein n=1 Tax=Ligilactobacillus animalis TaxID=1605 RepID=UPI0024328624|nr:hypothetical protein [Ligilactobacillus animalis]MCI5942925.1 hypothetical protein [Ligilactobacillus animalis]MDY2993759.1 hypothetical protein [Ligilactobacillus animalis]
MKNTTSIDEFMSDVMKKIKDEVYAAYYYGKQPQKSTKVLDELEEKLSDQLKFQWLDGWNAGRHELLDELKKKVVGGHK